MTTSGIGIKDADILADLVHLREQPSKVGPETALECVRRAIWGMLYADDACIVSRSTRGLGRMMAVFVEVFGAFGLTISESKTETMCMPIPRAPATKIEGFNDWGGRGYDDFVPGEVTKTAPSGDRTT